MAQKREAPLHFWAARQASKLMPDPNAGDTVAKTSIEVPDPSFGVVLRKGAASKHIFFKWEPSEAMWAGVGGTVVPIGSAEQLHQQLNGQVDTAVAEGLEIREDNRRSR